MDLESILRTPQLKKYDKFVMMTDFHVPYHDNNVLKLCLDIIKEIKPDKLILGGDIMDFYSVSKYDKNPERANQLQDEIDLGYSVLYDIRKATGKGEIIYLEGNHENRMQRYLWNHPEIADLRVLEVKNLLRLDDLLITYQQNVIHNGFIFKHGDYCNKYSANKELEVEGISGMSGHTHRIQTVYKTNRNGITSWNNIGHLSDASKSEYIKGIANWQQGFGIVYFDKENGEAFPKQIQINNNQIICNGKEYK
jgi:hypothetical protein